MMWMLNFVPDELLLMVIDAVLLAGIIGTVLSFFVVGWLPGFNRYKSLLQIVSVILLVAGVYFKGGYAIESEWRAKVQELEAKLAETEAKSKEVNTKIETRVVEKVKVVKQNVEVIKKEIQIQREEIDKECKLTPKAKEIHNKATISNIDGAINIHE